MKDRGVEKELYLCTVTIITQQSRAGLTQRTAFPTRLGFGVLILSHVIFPYPFKEGKEVKISSQRREEFRPSCW